MTADDAAAAATTIGMLVFPGAEELDFVGPWEVFTGSANLQRRDGREPDRVLLIAAALDPVRCAKGMRVLPDTIMGEHPPLDVVLVPGGSGVTQAEEDQEVLSWLTPPSATSSTNPRLPTPPTSDGRVRRGGGRRPPRRAREGVWTLAERWLGPGSNR